MLLFGKFCNDELVAFFEEGLGEVGGVFVGEGHGDPALVPEVGGVFDGGVLLEEGFLLESGFDGDARGGVSEDHEHFSGDFEDGVIPGEFFDGSREGSAELFKALDVGIGHGSILASMKLREGWLRLAPLVAQGEIKK